MVRGFYLSLMFFVDLSSFFFSITVGNPNITVFLLSLKAGGVALNLTEASRGEWKASESTAGNGSLT